MTTTDHGNYYSGNSYSQDDIQSGGGRGWKNYNIGGSVGPFKPTGNEGGRYGGCNVSYTIQK